MKIYLTVYFVLVQMRCRKVLLWDIPNHIVRFLSFYLFLLLLFIRLAFAFASNFTTSIIEINYLGWT